MTNWQTKKLGDVALITKGKRLSKDDITEGGKHLCIHYGELFLKYSEIIKEVRNRTNLSEDVFLSEQGDVLMPTSDVTPRGLATASYLPYENVVIGGDILVIRPEPKMLDGRFYSYYVAGNKSSVLRLTSGSTIFHLYGSDLKKLALDLPEKSEQERIVGVLEVWDEYIEKLEQKIALKEQLKKGLMQQLLTGKLRMYDFVEPWQTRKLGDICEISRGGSPRPIENYTVDNSEEGYSWLRIGDIKRGSRYITHTSQKIREDGLSKTTLVRKGDFILSNSMSFGRPYIMAINACIHDGWLALRNIDTGKMNKSYLYYLLSSHHMQNKFRAYSAGSGVQNLKKETVQHIAFTAPRVAEQEGVVAILANFDDDIDALRNKKNIIISQKKYLLKSLITGAIRTPDNLQPKGAN